MDIFQYNSYKDFIKNKIDENSHTKGYRASLATAAGCGQSFLSKALNSEVHFTLDHGAGMCHFWNLDSERTEYFLELMSYERAASRPLRRYAERRLDSLRAEAKRVAKREPSWVTLEESLKEAVYYSSWHYAAVHALTAMPGLVEAPTIAKRLSLPSSLVERTLRDLRSLGLVEQHPKGWRIKGGSVHLPKSSPLSIINQANWRDRAVHHLGQFPNDGVHYSALLVLGRKESEQVAEQLNALISRVVATAEKAPEEDLVCLNIDYFSV